MPLEIEITGEDCRWNVRYPGPDGRLGTPDDRRGGPDLHLPVDVPARVRLHSNDFVYTFALPDLGLQEIAVPELEFVLALRPDAAGRYRLRGDPMCGRTYPDLQGVLVVDSESRFRETVGALHSW